MPGDQYGDARQGAYVAKYAQKIAVGNSDKEPKSVNLLLLPVDDDTWVLSEMTPEQARMTAARLMNHADEVEEHNARQRGR